MHIGYYTGQLWFFSEILIIFISIYGWVGSWRCLVTWFCDYLIAKPGNKKAAPPWPDSPHVFYITMIHTVYPTKYAHRFCFAVLCCGYTLTDFPISIRLTSLALWQSNDCPSASKATLMNMDRYFMWIHYERLHNHNKTKHNKTMWIFLGIYCTRCTVMVLTVVFLCC